MGDSVPDEKRMRLKYTGNCRGCEHELPAGAEAIHERGNKTVRCLEHPHETVTDAEQPEVLHPGVPGASARREFERRHQRREREIRTKHPRLGGLIHALSEAPQSIVAWDTGAVGEERLGRRLNQLASDKLLVLHDRRIPGSRANIDHIAITPSGVYVIDAKRYRGRPAVESNSAFSDLEPRSSSWADMDEILVAAAGRACGEASGSGVGLVDRHGTGLPGAGRWDQA
ncbi:nuclease-related domain-containing protein [Nocardioides taihuensis]|uniref:Nuclease-related domain-containing protein n=1 Tax=Nocardioides taihuensis TaxID=1835606 RepID=A0ABW0BQB4_9ACTN